MEKYRRMYLYQTIKDFYNNELDAPKIVFKGLSFNFILFMYLVLIISPFIFYFKLKIGKIDYYFAVSNILIIFGLFLIINPFAKCRVKKKFKLKQKMSFFSFWGGAELEKFQIDKLEARFIEFQKLEKTIDIYEFGKLQEKEINYKSIFGLAMFSVIFIVIWEKVVEFFLIKVSDINTFNYLLLMVCFLGLTLVFAGIVINRILHDLINRKFNRNKRLLDLIQKIIDRRISKIDEK